MFYLHASNRTENLLSHLAEILRVDRQPDFFARELFLMQSQGMERMVAQTLTDEFRCFCNYKFFLPLDFLGFIAERLGLTINPVGFQRSTLTWRLEGLLRSPSGDVFKSIRTYLSGENSGLKRFRLARRLANIFDQYQIMRPEMIEKWDRGMLATTNPAEAWQMQLWLRLMAQPGGNLHRGRLLGQVIDMLKRKKEFPEPLPKRVSVVGVHTLPPVFLNFLNTLSNHMDIHLFVLSPCRSYWGDVESRRARLYRMGQETFDASSPKSEAHPLLATLGRQGRDLQNMMLEKADFALEFSSYADPLEGRERAAGTLLQKVQADLLEGILPDGRQLSSPATDDSIQVVSCHSKLRELSVLKDHLLNFLHHDGNLQLRNIIVMAPDIQQYAPLIPAVFNDIQHSIADRSMRRRNSIIGAFLSFLDLFQGRYGWREVLDVLRKPVIFPQFHLSLADLDNLQQWVVAAGIRWGLSGVQRSEDGLAGFTETSWRAGLERMLMGYAIDSDDFIDGVLPFTEIEGRAAYALGGLCRFIELVDQARSDFLQSRGVGDWSIMLQHIMGQLFGEDYNQELVELQTLVAELAEVVSLFNHEEIEFAVIREWFVQSAKESRSSSGFLRGQLTFCSMLPMRSIPFRVVCLIGVDDGIFPKNDNHDTFDLMGVDFRPGDRTPRGDDRYQFLEALLSAREKFYISYIGQSIQTNENIPPSVVVTELLEVLETGYGVSNIVVNHPLHPFSKKYFSKGMDPNFFSYSSYYCKTAEILQAGKRLPERWWKGRLDEDITEVAFADLLRFYNNPQKFFIKDRLGIILSTSDFFPEDRETFGVSGLDQYHIEDQLVRSALAGKKYPLLRKLQIDGQWPLGTFGLLSFSEKQAEIEAFVGRIHEQQMGAKRLDLPFHLTAGRYRLTGKLANVYDQGVLLIRCGKLRGRDLLSGWIHHLVLNQLGISGPTRIVAADMVVGFRNVATGPNLTTLLDHFAEGCLAPSMFFIEPAFAYALQLANPRSQVSPMQKALQTLNMRLQKGYEPEWSLIFGGNTEDVQPDIDFELFCREVMYPVWSAADAEQI